MSHPSITPTTPAVIDAALRADTERAEALLHSVAVELSRIRPAGRVAPLHVRALALKRDVARWKENAPPSARRHAIMAEIDALYETAKTERGKRR
jgi:hypothetical protein